MRSVRQMSKYGAREGRGARMAHAPTTHSSLLLRLRDVRDEEAWGHCVRLYAPLVYQYARRHGLQDADSADVTQEVLRALMNDAGRLEVIHRQGSLRSWLFTRAPPQAEEQTAAGR